MKEFILSSFYQWNLKKFLFFKGFFKKRWLKIRTVKTKKSYCFTILPLTTGCRSLVN